MYDICHVGQQYELGRGLFRSFREESAPYWAPWYGCALDTSSMPVSQKLPKLSDIAETLKQLNAKGVTPISLAVGRALVPRIAKAPSLYTKMVLGSNPYTAPPSGIFGLWKEVTYRSIPLLRYLP